MGGVRGIWKVRQLDRPLRGIPQRAHTYPGWSGPFLRPIRFASGQQPHSSVLTGPHPAEKPHSFLLPPWARLPCSPGMHLCLWGTRR